ncbi:MAG: YvcK family protein [Erysipelotrichaceae bacterium]|nr:YvcK family protein [Erysipelotrichaceae bacterium]
MLKIVLFCGGSGGKALQGGFDSLFGYGNYQLNAIINAYDNGKSTGVCRRIFDSDILGPSDLRKNQLTQYRLKYKNELKDPGSRESRLYELFELRMDGSGYQDYYGKAMDLIDGADYLEEKEKELFRSWTDHFFYVDKDHKELRKGIEEIRFKDFSLSNIFYASCASLNGNSLEKAGERISELLDIEYRVHMISDINLFLYNRTESGYLITDEGELVAWNNPNDKVTEAILKKKDGTDYLPKVGEESFFDIESVIKEADLMIFSSGTQWSSLIPTYMHEGFNELIRSCKAKKYLVMNNKEDLDCKGVGAEDLLQIIERYLDLTDIKIVLNDNADSSMNHVSLDRPQIHGVLSEKDNPKHDPEAVVRLIMRDLFDLHRDDYQLVSDLDGTLWDEKMEDKTIGIKCMELFKGVILSGNNYRHVYDVVRQYYRRYTGENIYCNYGNTYFTLEEDDGGKTLSEEFRIPKPLIDKLEAVPEYRGKITVRGEAILTIKPLTEREKHLKTISELIREYSDFKAEIAGHTSIDVMKNDFSKEKTFNLIIEKENLDRERILYLGNELTKGNDEAILRCHVQTVEVRDVFEAYLFLKTFYSD